MLEDIINNYLSVRKNNKYKTLKNKGRISINKTKRNKYIFKNKHHKPRLSHKKSVIRGGGGDGLKASKVKPDKQKTRLSKLGSYTKKIGKKGLNVSTKYSTKAIKYTKNKAKGVMKATYRRLWTGYKGALKNRETKVKATRNNITKLYEEIKRLHEQINTTDLLKPLSVQNAMSKQNELNQKKKKKAELAKKEKLLRKQENAMDKAELQHLEGQGKWLKNGLKVSTRYTVRGMVKFAGLGYRNLSNRYNRNIEDINQKISILELSKENMNPSQKLAVDKKIFKMKKERRALLKHSKILRQKSLENPKMIYNLFGIPIPRLKNMIKRGIKEINDNKHKLEIKINSGLKLYKGDDQYLKEVFQNNFKNINIKLKKLGINVNDINMNGAQGRAIKNFLQYVSNNNNIRDVQARAIRNILFRQIVNGKFHNNIPFEQLSSNKINTTRSISSIEKGKASIKDIGRLIGTRLRIVDIHSNKPEPKSKKSYKDKLNELQRQLKERKSAKTNFETEKTNFESNMAPQEYNLNNN